MSKEIRTRTANGRATSIGLHVPAIDFPRSDSPLPGSQSTVTGMDQAEPTDPAADPAEEVPDLGDFRGRTWLSRISPAVLILVAVIPFGMLPVTHLLSDPVTATGFYHEELPYYVANGRAAFERGNGFAYPNPYDADPAAPSIYAHWFLWGLGLLPATLGADPGDVLLAVTFFAAVLFSAMTWQLVRVRCTPETSSHGPFLLAMWGGGLLSAGGLIAGLCGRTDAVSTILQFDPGRGLWFLSWGRNAIFATEAIYHALVAGCWICELRGRRIGGTVCCAALATTHPWSGLELLLILCLWRGVQWMQHRNRVTTGYLLVVIAMLAAFLSYYKLWLPQFTHHQKLEHAWELDWSLSWLSAGLGYSLVLVPAAVRLWRSFSFGSTRLSLQNADRFLLCALGVAVGLVFHDRFVRPVQPLHFTRGYIWMPLFLLGLPVLQEWWLRAVAGERLVRLAASGLAVLFVADNVSFGLIHSDWLISESNGFHLTADDRAILQHLHRYQAGAVVLSESHDLNYLMPTYASVRPWVGHPFNTPDNNTRRERMARIFSGDSVSPEFVPQEIDCLLVRHGRKTNPLADSPRWVQLDSHNATWELWGQVQTVRISEAR